MNKCDYNDAWFSYCCCDYIMKSGTICYFGFGASVENQWRLCIYNNNNNNNNNK